MDNTRTIYVWQNKKIEIDLMYICIKKKCERNIPDLLVAHHFRFFCSVLLCWLLGLITMSKHAKCPHGKQKVRAWPVRNALSLDGPLMTDYWVTCACTVCSLLPFCFPYCTVQSRCKECGGSGLCPHGKRKVRAWPVHDTLSHDACVICACSLTLLPLLLCS